MKLHLICVINCTTNKTKPENLKYGLLRFLKFFLFKPKNTGCSNQCSSLDSYQYNTIIFKVKCTIALQSLYSQLWERGEKQMGFSLVLNVGIDTVKMSLLMADCSKFLLRRRGTLGRRSWRVVQSVPRSMMNAGVVDQEVQRQAVKRQPGRPAPVHGHTHRRI